ncbi:MAG: outer membrane protein assembly factor BamE [Planctomycetes bacterium]|nr:outer membrane protein assembly factor BamE [Planctomycetota bacterium]
MGPIRYLRRHPLALFALAVLVFGAWVAVDALTKPPRYGPADPNEYTLVGIEAPGSVPAPARAEPCAPRPTPQATAQALPKLKPGMTRTEVEQLVGAPEPADIHPVVVVDGRATYHTAYEADLDPPATVRPVGAHRPMPAERMGPTRTTVKLEFDATKPGHPLVGVHYPEPAF